MQQATTQGGKKFQSDPWIITVKPLPPPEPPPVAKFRINGDHLKANDPVEFVGESTGLNASYRWDFGGEGSSTEKNPHFTFEQPGNKTIKLTVEGPGGKSSAETVLEIASVASGVKPLWLVGRFTARKEWLGLQPQLQALEKDWGAALAVYVEHALKKRSIRTDVSKSELTEPETRRLVQEGLKYYCGGELELLETSNTAIGDVTAKLTVTYRLQKLFQDKLRTIQQSRISVSQISSKTVSEEDLRRLLEAVAEEIAKRVVTDIPADLLASRG